MSKASDLFERVAKRAPFQPGSGGWAAWVSREMDEAEKFDELKLKLQRDEEDEGRRHRQQVEAFRVRWQRLQQLCKHENIVRGTAEGEPVCQDCGGVQP